MNSLELSVNQLQHLLSFSNQITLQILQQLNRDLVTIYQQQYELVDQLDEQIMTYIQGNKQETQDSIQLQIPNYEHLQQRINAVLLQLNMEPLAQLGAQSYCNIEKMNRDVLLLSKPSWLDSMLKQARPLERIISTIVIFRAPIQCQDFKIYKASLHFILKYLNNQQSVQESCGMYHSQNFCSCVDQMKCALEINSYNINIDMNLDQTQQQFLKYKQNVYCSDYKCKGVDYSYDEVKLVQYLRQWRYDTISNISLFKALIQYSHGCFLAIDNKMSMCQCYSQRTFKKAGQQQQKYVTSLDNILIIGMNICLSIVVIYFYASKIVLGQKQEASFYKEIFTLVGIIIGQQIGVLKLSKELFKQHTDLLDVIKLREKQGQLSEIKKVCGIYLKFFMFQDYDVQKALTFRTEKDGCCYKISSYAGAFEGYSINSSQLVDYGILVGDYQSINIHEVKYAYSQLQSGAVNIEKWYGGRFLAGLGNLVKDVQVG